MNKKIDFASLNLNPIEKFSGHINANLRQTINDYLTTQSATESVDWATIEELTKKIKQTKQSIENEKINSQIKLRSFINKMIILFSIFLIGLLFMSVYYENKQVIDQFEKNVQKSKKLINRLIDQRFKLMVSAFSTTTFRDAYKHIFTTLGISPIEYLPYQRLYSIISSKYKNVIGLTGIGGLIKNSPFYDVVFYEFQIRNVKTYDSVDVEYFIEDDDDEFTDFETEDAVHVEPTPFLVRHNALIYMTNFEPELTFSTNNKKYDRHLGLKNREFMRTYRLRSQYSNQEKLANFLTLKAQENLIDWADHEEDEWFAFSKEKGCLVVWNDNESKQPTNCFNLPLSWFINQSTNPRFSASVNLAKVTDVVNKYFKRLTKMLQIPLLIPGIVDEWYQSNGRYLIAERGESDNDIHTHHYCDGFDLLPKFNKSILIQFISAHRMKRPSWITLESSTKLNHCSINKILLHSYWSQTCFDCVDIEDGDFDSDDARIKYKKFHKVQEEKMIITAPALLNEDAVVVCSSSMKDLISDYIYKNKELKKFVNNNALWTNHPEHLERLINQRVFSLISKFTQICNQNEKLRFTFSLQLDQTGTYLIANDPSLLNEAVLGQITDAIELSLNEQSTLKSFAD